MMEVKSPSLRDENRLTIDSVNCSDTESQELSPDWAEPVLYCIYAGNMERVPFGRVLHSACCYLLIDIGRSRLYIWIGIHSYDHDRTYAEYLADLILKKDLNDWTLSPPISESAMNNPRCKDTMTFQAIISTAPHIKVGLRFPTIGDGVSETFLVKHYLYRLAFPPCTSGQPLMETSATERKCQSDYVPLVRLNLLMEGTTLDLNHYGKTMHEVDERQNEHTGSGRLPASLILGHQDGVFLLETLHESFLFFSQHCSEDDRERALCWVQEQDLFGSYLFVTVVEEGMEPVVFKERFYGWDQSYSIDQSRKLQRPIPKQGEQQEVRSERADEGGEEKSDPERLKFKRGKLVRTASSSSYTSCPVSFDEGSLSLSLLGSMNIKARESSQIHQIGRSNTSWKPGQQGGGVIADEWRGDPAEALMPLSAGGIAAEVERSMLKPDVGTIQLMSAGIGDPSNHSLTMDKAYHNKGLLRQYLIDFSDYNEKCEEQLNGNTRCEAKTGPDTAAGPHYCENRNIKEQWRESITPDPHGGDLPLNIPDGLLNRPSHLRNREQVETRNGAKAGAGVGLQESMSRSSKSLLWWKEVPHSRLGVFTSQDAYLVLYNMARLVIDENTSSDGGAPSVHSEVQIETVLYLWTGRDYEAGDGLRDVLKSDVDDHLLGDLVFDDSHFTPQGPTKLFVEQGREPPFFLAMFCARLPGVLCINGSVRSKKIRRERLNSTGNKKTLGMDVGTKGETRIDDVAGEDSMLPGIGKGEWQRQQLPQVTRAKVFEVIQRPRFPFTDPKSVICTQINSGTAAVGLDPGKSYIIIQHPDNCAHSFENMYLWHGYDEGDAANGLLCHLLGNSHLLFPPPRWAKSKSKRKNMKCSTEFGSKKAESGLKGGGGRGQDKNEVGVPPGLCRGFVQHLSPDMRISEEFWKGLGINFANTSMEGLELRTMRPVRLFVVDHLLALENYRSNHVQATNACDSDACKSGISGTVGEGGVRGGTGGRGIREAPYWPAYVREVGPLGVFSQDDLMQDYCFLLDTGSDAVYAWHGEHASSASRELCVRIAKVFVSSTLVGVNVSPVFTPVLLQVESGSEPADFLSCFSNWVIRKKPSWRLPLNASSGLTTLAPCVKDSAPINPYTLTTNGTYDDLVKERSQGNPTVTSDLHLVQSSGFSMESSSPLSFLRSDSSLSTTNESEGGQASPTLCSLSTTVEVLAEQRGRANGAAGAEGENENRESLCLISGGILKKGQDHTCPGVVPDYSSSDLSTHSTTTESESDSEHPRSISERKPEAALDAGHQCSSSSRFRRPTVPFRRGGGRLSGAQLVGPAGILGPGGVKGQEQTNEGSKRMRSSSTPHTGLCTENGSAILPSSATALTTRSSSLRKEIAENKILVGSDNLGLVDERHGVRETKADEKRSVVGEGQRISMLRGKMRPQRPPLPTEKRALSCPEQGDGCGTNGTRASLGEEEIAGGEGMSVFHGIIRGDSLQRLNDMQKTLESGDAGREMTDCDEDEENSLLSDLSFEGDFVPDLVIGNAERWFNVNYEEEEEEKVDGNEGKQKEFIEEGKAKVKAVPGAGTGDMECNHEISRPQLHAKISDFISLQHRADIGIMSEEGGGRSMTLQSCMVVVGDGGSGKEWTLRRSLADFRGLYFLLAHECQGMKHEFPRDGKPTEEKSLGLFHLCAQFQEGSEWKHNVEQLDLWLGEVLAERELTMSAHSRFRLYTFLGVQNELQELDVQLYPASQPAPEGQSSHCVVNKRDSSKGVAVVSSASSEAAFLFLQYVPQLVPDGGIFFRMTNELDDLRKSTVEHKRRHRHSILAVEHRLITAREMEAIELEKAREVEKELSALESAHKNGVVNTQHLEGTSRFSSDDVNNIVSPLVSRDSGEESPRRDETSNTMHSCDRKGSIRLNVGRCAKSGHDFSGDDGFCAHSSSNDYATCTTLNGCGWDREGQTQYDHADHQSCGLSCLPSEPLKRLLSPPALRRVERDQARSYKGNPMGEVLQSQGLDLPTVRRVATMFCSDCLNEATDNEEVRRPNGEGLHSGVRDSAEEGPEHDPEQLGASLADERIPEIDCSPDKPECMATTPPREGGKANISIDGSSDVGDVGGGNVWPSEGKPSPVKSSYTAVSPKCKNLQEEGGLSATEMPGPFGIVHGISGGFCMSTPTRKAILKKTATGLEQEDVGRVAEEEVGIQATRIEEGGRLGATNPTRFLPRWLSPVKEGRVPSVGKKKSLKEDSPLKMTPPMPSKGLSIEDNGGVCGWGSPKRKPPLPVNALVCHTEKKSCNCNCCSEGKKSCIQLCGSGKGIHQARDVGVEKCLSHEIAPIGAMGVVNAPLCPFREYAHASYRAKKKEHKELIQRAELHRLAFGAAEAANRALLEKMESISARNNVAIDNYLKQAALLEREQGRELIGI